MTDDAGAPESTSSPRALSHSRRVLFSVIVLAGCYGLLEGVVHLVFQPVVPVPLEVTADTAQPDVTVGREAAGLGFRDPTMALHPYLGYVYLPNAERETPGPAAIPVSEDGFLDPRPAVRQRSEGRLIIGVTGGSVAGQLGVWHGELLRTAMRAHPRFADVELDFVWLGMPGYHQPQQVIQLSYILAQGGELDVLLNLDGFNEIACPVVLNAKKGTHPLFPMNWSMVALDVPDTHLRRTAGAIDYLKRERYDRAVAFRSSFWSFSPLAKTLRQRDDERLERRIGEYMQELTAVSTEEIPWFVRGPRSLPREEELLIRECVEVWERCSRQIEALCAANGIRYLHFLQPNQYDPGSKPLSAEERAKAFDEDGAYRSTVVEGYPLLKQAGERLRAAGIAFHDLSMIFGEVEETIYVDTCCHFNALGNRIMARAIAAAVRGAF